MRDETGNGEGENGERELENKRQLTKERITQRTQKKPMPKLHPILIYTHLGASPVVLPSTRVCSINLFTSRRRYTVLMLDLLYTIDSDVWRKKKIHSSSKDLCLSLFSMVLYTVSHALILCPMHRQCHYFNEILILVYRMLGIVGEWEQTHRHNPLTVLSYDCDGYVSITTAV